jgi:hypothetical protein
LAGNTAFTWAMAWLGGTLAVFLAHRQSKDQTP